MYDPDHIPCLFSDICHEECKCCHYSPSTDYSCDPELIEEERSRYYREWYQYLGDEDSPYNFYALNTI